MNPLKSTVLLKEVMTKYYQSITSPVAWCTSAGPAELLRAFGFHLYFPENHGALMGATRTANHFIPYAVNAGYSGDICSYLTSDIGAYLAKTTPLTKAYGLSSIPKPDLIVYNTNQCREVADWFGYYAREFNCPIVGIHPPRYLENISDADIDLVVHQLKGIIPVCEETSGVKFDIERFIEVLQYSSDAAVLWQKVVQTAKSRPAPLTFFDGTIQMGPIVVLRGMEECVTYYQTLLNELKERIEEGVGAVDQEKYRIFWDGMPVWGRLRIVSELFADNQAAVVVSTYCNSWVFDAFDLNKPFRSLAQAYTRIFINRGEKTKLHMLKNWVAEFDIDGIVFHDAKTCFNNSNNRFGLPDRLRKETGIPTLVIEGDLNDLRFYSDGQNQTKIETFMEQIAV